MTTEQGFPDINPSNQVRLLELFAASSDGLWEMAPDGTCKYFTPGFYSQFAFTSPESHISEWQALLHPEDVAPFESNLKQQLEKGVARLVSKYRIRNRSGEYVWIESTGIVSVNDDGDLAYMVGSHRNITREKTQQSELYKLAYIDPLTQCYNRRKLVETLSQTELAINEGAFLYFSLDDLKTLTDTFGFSFGSEIIKDFSIILKRVFSTFGGVYRLEGGEFAVCINAALVEEQITKLINFAINSFIADRHANEQAHCQNISVGVCILPLPDVDAEALLYQAKLAMLFAQKSGRRICFSNHDNYQRVKRQLFIETGIKAALYHKEFYLLFQPIVSAIDQTVTSFEALLRWKSPTHGDIYPDEFIPISERNKTIIELGYFVIAKACEFILDCNAKGLTGCRVSINVSVVQLLQPKFVQRLLQTLERYGIESQQLVIEITESMILETEATAMRQIHELRNNGFSVSLDDFGTGYSSLEVFFSIPFNQLKIDRKIIGKAITEWQVSDYLTSLVSLCQRRGINVVGEGIENKQMLAHGRKIGLDFLQGYHFARPIDSLDAIDYAKHTQGVDEEASDESPEVECE
uniref:putative bifunctional diguanylate cyclase/phosphodiesterase n=1 Tax=Thaumasiovibrio occultus TaxID=1891184 RepID=UPI000B351ED8|nr:EAL domain-containing protein [Thaumasiovibrio occultus]